MNTLLRIVAVAIATAAAVWLVPGISLTNLFMKDKIITLFFVAIIIAIVNATIKPIVKVFSFPLTILTLGFFALVVNALMLMLASSIARAFSLGFHVSGFWPALFGSIIISIVTAIANVVLGVEDKR